MGTDKHLIARLLIWERAPACTPTGDRFCLASLGLLFHQLPRMKQGKIRTQQTNGLEKATNTRDDGICSLNDSRVLCLRACNGHSLLKKSK